MDLVTFVARFGFFLTFIVYTPVAPAHIDLIGTHAVFFSQVRTYFNVVCYLS